MENKLQLYNSLTRKKEIFEPINPPFVGMYVCGPTVYGEPHLGHVRMGITFDVLYRILKYLGYNVRYVRNITDVGHLEDEAMGEGEDRIEKKARAEKLEPMEIVQKYRNIFNHIFDQLNILSPSIEPQASGHIIEQQQMIKKILENGYAYEVDGSVYFDLDKYNNKYPYGKLSGRKLEDLQSNTRELEGQHIKKKSYDFALWKKATPEHIMRWPSDWSDGYPGWHLECSVMSAKYLGTTFDIHGGGMDLMFPHHECEIAQSVAASGKEHVKYWVHNNMITIDGQKMAKSLNNFITLQELFSGEHEKLEQAYSPMTTRMFVLQAHYHSTLDFSNKSLQDAEINYQRLMNGVKTLNKVKKSKICTIRSEIDALRTNFWKALFDDINTQLAISHLLEGVKLINSVNDNNEKISSEYFKILNDFMNTVVFEVLGFKIEENTIINNELTGKLIETLLTLRQEAKDRKDYALSDDIRQRLMDMGVAVKDTKDGFEWEIS